MAKDGYDVFVLALTGGIGSGKSTAAAVFRSKGAVVLELDQVAAHLMEPGSLLAARVAAEFGPSVIGEDGAIDRAELAHLAFRSPEDAERLNQIVHPSVASEVGPSITDLRLLPNPPEVVVIDVPLLVEAPVFGELADRVLTIEAPEELRVSRAVARGMSEADARSRVACQATDEERREIADDVIENVGSIGEFEKSIEQYWAGAVRRDP